MTARATSVLRDVNRIETLKPTNFNGGKHMETGPKAGIKCPRCNGEGRMQEEGKPRPVKCTECNGSGLKK
jgi:DnaJ-class molecular chaperone